MLKNYSKILIALFIVTLFFAVSVAAVSATVIGNGGDQGGNNGNLVNGNNFGGDGGHNCTPTPSVTLTPTPTFDPCDWNHYDARYCPPKQGNCDGKDWNKDYDGRCPTPTPTPSVTPSPTPTPTETQTSNPGGPGDGLGCATHDCSGNQVGGGSTTQAVLGASTGPTVLGLSYTSGEESFLPQLLQLFGALTSGGLGLVFFKKNA